MADAIVPALKLTTKSTSEIRNELVARIPTITDRWTDFNEAELGIMILTTLTGLIEAVNFELDMRASETTRSHVRLRKNAVRLFSLIGYSFNRKVPSRTTLRFSVGSPAPKSIPLPSYLDDDPVQASTAGTRRISFSTETTSVIPAGSTQALVIGLQGIKREENFTATSDPDQVFVLTGTNIGEGTIRIKVDGVFWEIVDHFVDSDENSRHVRIITDEVGTVHIFFGDGISGMIPSGQIDVIYLETLGRDGDLAGQNRVVSLDTALTDIDGAPVTVAVTNIEDATGGEDEETLFHAKKQAPREYAAQQRAVTRLDFQAWTEGYPGIKQAAIIDINDVGLDSFEIDGVPFIEFFQLKIPVIPTSGYLPSAALKKGLQEFLEEKKPVPDDIEIIDPAYIPVDVLVDLYVRSSYDQNAVKAAVVSVIEEFFQIAESPAEELKLGGEVEGQMFGADVFFSQLLAAIQNVSGVSSISSLIPSEDVSIEPFEIAILAAGSPIVNVIGTV